jgi:hypothetical protein
MSWHITRALLRLGFMLIHPVLEPKEESSRQEQEEEKV